MPTQIFFLLARGCKWLASRSYPKANHEYWSTQTNEKQAKWRKQLAEANAECEDSAFGPDHLDITNLSVAEVKASGIRGENLCTQVRKVTGYLTSCIERLSNCVPHFMEKYIKQFIIVSSMYLY